MQSNRKIRILLKRCAIYFLYRDSLQWCDREDTLELSRDEAQDLHRVLLLRVELSRAGIPSKVKGQLGVG